MNSMFQVFNNSKKIISDTAFKGKVDAPESYFNAEIGQSLFSLLKEFNDFSQSIYETILLQAGVDYDTHLILLNIYTDQSISLVQLLMSTGLSYGSLKPLLKNLENSQFVTISGLENDPESIQLVLTGKGIDLFESIQQCVNAAGLDILTNLPKCGVHLRNILIDRSEETLVLEQNNKLFNDDLFIELEDSTSHKIDKPTITREKKTVINSMSVEQIAIPTVLIEDEILDSEKGCISSQKIDVPAIKATELKKWALKSLTKNKGVISLKEACEVAFGKCPDSLKNAHLRQLAQKLSAEKIGISPDPKFSFKQQEFSDCGVLFNLSFSTKTVEQEKVSDNYRIAYLMLHLGMKAAQSDDIIVDAETDIIQKIVMKNPGLSASEKARLQADMKRLMQSKISLEFMALMLKDLSSKHKEGVAHLAFRVVTSDNIIETSELNFLLWLYEQLGFSHEKVQQKIQMIGDLPETIVKNFPELMLTNILGYSAENTDHNDKKDAELKTSEIDVDFDEHDEVSVTHTLDENRISELRHDDDSSDCLQEIFSTSYDEEEENGSVLFDDIHDERDVEGVDNNIDETQSIEGLDALHSKLLLSLFEKDNPNWDWFEVHTRECGLMANGAMETLNEWAYDNYNEPILEDDPFSVNEEFYSYLDLAEKNEITENISKTEETEQVTNNEDDLVRDDRQKYSKFLEDLLAEKNLDQDRFTEIASSYGLAYDEALELFIKYWGGRI